MAKRQKSGAKWQRSNHICHSSSRRVRSEYRIEHQQSSSKEPYVCRRWFTYAEREKKGNLYSVEFFYELEKDGAKSFFSKEEITSAIKKAINTGIEQNK